MIYPIPIVDGERFESSLMDEVKYQYRKTHKIIRLEIEIENDIVVLVKAIIVSDLVSNQYMK